jgi:hypothetical protein
MRKIMNLKQILFPQRAILLPIILAVAGSAYAGFTYNARDLVLGFRVDGGGDYEMTINAGPVSTFYSLPVGQTITVSNITPSLLTSTFGDLNNLDWSAAADVRTNGDASFPIQTDWVTQQRTDLNTQSTPWPTRSQFSQANANAKIDGIAGSPDLGAVSYGGQVPTGPTNTATLVVIPGGLSPYAYSTFVGNGNYNNTFPGVVEASTGPTFTTDGQVVRADLYQLKPSSPNGVGTYLGYFEFNTNGVMTYTSGPSGGITVPRPGITGVTRVGTTTTVIFTTVNGGQYSLRYTNNAGLKAPVSTWPVAGSPISGNGSTNSISDVTGDAQRFYSISAH